MPALLSKRAAFDLGVGVLGLFGAIAAGCMLVLTAVMWSGVFGGMFAETFVGGAIALWIAGFVYFLAKICWTHKLRYAGAAVAGGALWCVYFFA